MMQVERLLLNQCVSLQNWLWKPHHAAQPRNGQHAAADP